MKLEMDIGSSSKLPIDMDFKHVFDLEMTKKMFNFGGEMNFNFKFYRSLRLFELGTCGLVDQSETHCTTYIDTKF